MDWSKQINLVFNSKKMKIMLFSHTLQTSRINNDRNLSKYPLTTSDKISEGVNSYKALNIMFSKNLAWTEHVNKVTNVNTTIL